ncbi:CPBP family intramembrane glutamic endopeptidase [Brachybacterium sp. GCM10030252]|uniref:CPBP family intramembrane glutamic endopeptidase n=1 Tax=Brachybacterium sp. GCM10030252 TaxID=3273380 RepID=UPI0036160BAF
MLVIANRELLARHWRAMWRAKWRSLGLILVGMVVIQIVISLLGAILRPLSGADLTEESVVPEQASIAFGVVLFASLGPTVTALVEDFTFRHTLLMKFPVWNKAALAALLVVGNALVFGLIHVNNFDGHWLLTLAYAGAGLVMNLVYLWTRNIWHVLLMHALNNFLLGGPVIVLFVHLMEGAIGA